MCVIDFIKIIMEKFKKVRGITQLLFFLISLRLERVIYSSNVPRSNFEYFISSFLLQFLDIASLFLLLIWSLHHGI